MPSRVTLSARQQAKSCRLTSLQPSSLDFEL
jgi:hypothetical protein